MTKEQEGEYMELLEILDERGQKTGQLLDKDEIHKKGLYHREVALILMNYEGEILLQKRASAKEVQPNKWAWHGGHVLPDETDREGIIREAEEELGVTLQKTELNILIQTKRDKVPNRQFTTVFFSICNLSAEQFTIQKEELSEVKWFPYEEFMIYEEHPDMMFKNNENTSKILKAIEEKILPHLS